MSRLVVRLRKAVSTDTLSSVVPQDLEGSARDEGEEWHNPHNEPPPATGLPQRNTRSAAEATRAVVRLRKADQLPGGRADGRSPSDFDADDLEEGTKHEFEHTNDRAKAREIAMDHLAEDPHYYRKLRRMEKAVYRTEKGERRGTPVAFGLQGATVIDHETGEAHRVDHGHYFHEEGDGEPTPWKETAKNHLALGPRSPHALHALAALAADAGCEKPLSQLKRADVKVSGNRVSFGGKHVDDPAAAATARWFLSRKVPEEDLWSWEEGGARKRLDDKGIEAYRAKHGALPPPEQTGTRAQTTARTITKAPSKKRAVVGATAPMRKAEVATALHFAADMVPVTEWEVRGYRAVLRSKRLADKAVNVLTIMGKGLALPFQCLVRDAVNARQKADLAAAAFDAGDVPYDGVFVRIEEA